MLTSDRFPGGVLAANFQKISIPLEGPDIRFKYDITTHTLHVTCRTTTYNGAMVNRRDIIGGVSLLTERARLEGKEYLEQIGEDRQKTWLVVKVIINFTDYNDPETKLGKAVIEVLAVNLEHTELRFLIHEAKRTRAQQCSHDLALRAQLCPRRFYRTHRYEANHFQ